MRTKSIITALSTVVLALAVAVPAQGAITVANTNDSGPGSLRQAIETAPAGETIELPAGTYPISSAPLLLERSLTIAGHGVGDTILRGAGASHAFFANGEFDVVIKDLTVREFTAFNAPYGVAVFSVGTNVTMERVAITANTASADGGLGSSGGNIQGGMLYTISGSLRLIDSSVTGNTITADGNAGKEGGVIQGGLILTISPLAMAETEVSGNLVRARGGTGPPSAEQNGGSIQGGVVLALQEKPIASSITASTFAANIADASGGPGGEGGGIAGGTLLLATSSAPLVISNATVARNTARTLGSPDGLVQGAGALLTAGPNGPVTVTHATIASNRTETGDPAAFGGNVLAVGPVGFGATIVADGGGPFGSENCFLLGAAFSLGFNIDSVDQCGFHATGDKVNTAPVLGQLEDNGGPVPTMAIPPQSQAVDQGAAFGSATDARGVLRPVDFPTIPNSAAAGSDGSDIGAYELRPDNSLTLGKPKKNKKKGTGSVLATVPLPSAGTIVLTGKGLKKQTKTVAGQARFSLKLIPTGKAKKALRKKGKRKIAFKVTYTPTGNTPAVAQKKLKLVKRKQGKHKEK